MSSSAGFKRVLLHEGTELGWANLSFWPSPGGKGLTTLPSNYLTLWFYADALHLL